MRADHAGPVLRALANLYSSPSEALEATPFVKTIVASRPNNDIKIAFDILPTIRLRGEDEPEAISKDVELVIQYHIENAVRRGLPGFSSRTCRRHLSRSRSDIPVDDARDRASGSAARCIKRELLEFSVLATYFGSITVCSRTVSTPRRLRRLLHIIIAAARPLTLSEISVAAAIGTTHQTLDELELDIVHNFEERIKALCGNFIRVVRSTVYLVHQTAREFLLQEANGRRLSSDPLGRWQHSINLQRARSDLLDICFHYLDLFNVPILQSSEDPMREKVISIQFLDYCARFWTCHYAEVAPSLSAGSDICVYSVMQLPHSQLRTLVFPIDRVPE